MVSHKSFLWYTSHVGLKPVNRNAKYILTNSAPIWATTWSLRRFWHHNQLILTSPPACCRLQTGDILGQSPFKGLQVWNKRNRNINCVRENLANLYRHVLQDFLLGGLAEKVCRNSRLSFRHWFFTHRRPLEKLRRIEFSACLKAAQEN